MEKYFLPFIIFLVLTACGNRKELEEEKIVFRNDIAYEVNSEIPYTGFVYSNYDQDLPNLMGKNLDVDPIRMFTTEYKDGIKDGLHLYYFENGQILAKGNYSKSKFDGEWKNYFENGQVKGIWNYSYGNLDGKTIEYYENGQVWYENTYIDGKLWNVHQDFHPDGTPVEGNTLNDGTGIVNAYERNGDFIGSNYYIDGVIVD